MTTSTRQAVTPDAEGRHGRPRTWGDVATEFATHVEVTPSSGSDAGGRWPRKASRVATSPDSGG